MTDIPSPEVIKASVYTSSGSWWPKIERSFNLISIFFDFNNRHCHGTALQKSKCSLDLALDLESKATGYNVKGKKKGKEETLRETRSKREPILCEKKISITYINHCVFKNWEHHQFFLPSYIRMNSLCKHRFTDKIVIVTILLSSLNTQNLTVSNTYASVLLSRMLRLITGLDFTPVRPLSIILIRFTQRKIPIAVLLCYSLTWQMRWSNTSSLTSETRKIRKMFLIFLLSPDENAVDRLQADRAVKFTSC